jgi:hypothetical protein
VRCRRWDCPIHTRAARRRLRDIADQAHANWAAGLVAQGEATHYPKRIPYRDETGRHPHTIRTCRSPCSPSPAH